MRLVSSFLKHVVYPGLAKTGYLRRHAGAGPAIVTYHGIRPAGYKALDPALDGGLVTADSFRRQLHLLSTRYNIISPTQFLCWCESGQLLPERSVLLTCDDGLQNTLTDMLPILRELRLSCLFFVTGASLSEKASILWYEELYLLFLTAGNSFILNLLDEDIRVSVTTPDEGRARWWELVKKLSQFDQPRRRQLLERIREQLRISPDWKLKYSRDSVLHRRFFVLTGDELLQLAAAGMSIGAHTLSHPMLSKMPEELSWTEIFDSRRALEQSLDQPIWALAYPFGDPTSIAERDEVMAEKAGFKCAFLNFGGGLGAPNPMFALPRVHVTAAMTLAEFEAHVSGFYRVLRHYSSTEKG